MLTTPFLRALRRTFPVTPITFVTKAAYHSLATSIPFVTDVCSLAPDESLKALATRLQVQPRDHFVDLHVSWRTTRLRHLLGGAWTTFTKPRFQRWKRIWGLGTPSIQHMAVQYSAAGQHFDVVLDDNPPELRGSDEALATAMQLIDEGAVVLAPGASRATKRWPIAHWRSLAKLLRAQGERVVGIGERSEHDAFDDQDITPLFGYPLDVVVEVCRRARVLVTNDSGLMHVGTAVGTPVIAIFGPTTPDLGFAPYTSRAVVVEQDVPCRPCSVIGHDRCPAGHHRCLTTITPNMVLRAVASFS